MADIARQEISPSPSKVGRVLSSIGKFTVDYTLADFLTGINGRKKVHEFVQQKLKGSSPLPLPLRRPTLGDIEVIVHDVQEVVKKGQVEAVKLHESCLKSVGGGPEICKKMQREVPKEVNHLGTNNRNKVFIRSRL